MTRKQLWAPWRRPYIARAERWAGKSGSSCLFCKMGKSRQDVRNLVVTRGRLGFCLLNLFPYNNGHLLVAPYRHVGELGDLQEEEWLDLFRLADDGITRLRKVLKPQAFNLGINLGCAAGAGIPDHLHLHIVPRWTGDTNFMPICADTKVVSQSLRSAQRLLRRVRVQRRRD